MFCQSVKLSVMDIKPWGMKTGGQTGIYVELADILAKEAGLTPEIVVVPYKRNVLDMESGASVFCFMTENPEIVKVAKNVGVLKKLEIIVMGNKGFSISKLSDLEGKTIGTLLGVLNYPAFDDNPKIKKNPVEGPEQQIKMLQLKRMDAIQGVREATLYAKRKLEKETGTSYDFSAPFIISTVDAQLWISNKSYTK